MIPPPAPPLAPAPALATAPPAHVPPYRTLSPTNDTE